MRGRETEEERAAQHAGGEDRCLMFVVKLLGYTTVRNVLRSDFNLWFQTGVEREHQGSLQGAPGFTF